MASDNHRYRVFISYNHRDKAWAEWLEQKLEGYRVPRGLEGKSQIFESVPKRLKPVFRDRSTAAAGGALPDRVRDWLDASESLIVICSPNSAQPNLKTGQHWVDEEIEHFRALGKAHRVFALIVDGEPGSNREDEAFPPAFREIHPAAADARDVGDGKNLALMKVVAGLLGVELIDLQAKQNFEDRRRARTAGLAAGGFAGLALIALSGLWLAASNYWGSQVTRSKTLAGFAFEAVNEGHLDVALLLALAGSKSGEGLVRPQPPDIDLALAAAREELILQAVLDSHRDDVLRVAYSPDGRFALSHSADATVKVWNPNTGQLVASLSHGAEIHQAEFLADSEHILTVSRDGLARLWRVESGDIIQSFGGQSSLFDRVTLSSDSSILVGGGLLRFLDLDSGADIERFSWLSGTYAEHVAFSPDGSMIVVSGFSDRFQGNLPTITVGDRERLLALTIEVATGEVQSVIRLTDIPIADDSQSPDTRQAVHGLRAALGMTGGRIVEMTSPLRFSPDGTYLVAGFEDGTARVWQADSGVIVARFDGGHTSPVTEVLFSPDSSVVATGSTAVLGSQFRPEIAEVSTRFWDIETGRQIFHLDMRPEHLTEADWRIKFSSDGTRYFYSSGLFNNIGILKFSQDGLALGPVYSQGVSGHSDRVTDFDIHPEGRQLVTGSEDNTVRFWDVSLASSPIHLNPQLNPISGLGYVSEREQLITVTEQRLSRDEPRLINSPPRYDRKLVIENWNVTTGRQERRIETELTGSFVQSQIHTFGESAWMSTPGDSIRIVDLTSGSEIAELHGPEGLHYTDLRRFTGVMSPNGTQFAARDQGFYRTSLELEARANRPRLPETDAGDIQGASMDGWFRVGRQERDTASHEPDVELDTATAFSNTRFPVVVWDITLQAPQFVLGGHEGTVTSIQFSPDGSRLLTTAWDGTAKVWDMSDGRLLYSLVGHEAGVIDGAYSPAGSLIVTSSSDHDARLWDAQSGELICVLRGHSDEVDRAQFNEDGTRVATASSDHTARVWDTDSCETLQELDAHSDRVLKTSLSPNGALAFTVSNDGSSRLWDVQTGRAISNYQTSPDHQIMLDTAFLGEDRLVTIDFRQRPYVYDISGFALTSAELVAAACDQLPLGRRRLDSDYARRFLGDPNHPDAAPCDRVGPLSPRFYTRALSNLFSTGSYRGSARGSIASTTER